MTVEVKAHALNSAWPMVCLRVHSKLCTADSSRELQVVCLDLQISEDSRESKDRHSLCNSMSTPSFPSPCKVLTIFTPTYNTSTGQTAEFCQASRISIPHHNPAVCGCR